MKRTSRTTKTIIWSLVLQLVFGIAPKGSLGDDRPTNPDIGPQAFELLSYQALDYRFLVIPADETPPSGFEQPDFDDSDLFSTGSAAFGSGGDCPLQQTVQTAWPVDSQLLVRRNVSIPAGATNVRIMVSVDNHIDRVFFNGTSIAENISHDGCPILDEFRIDVPQNLVQTEQNLVVFHLRNRGDGSFFDARILARLSESEFSNTVADQIISLEQTIPQEPISDIEFDCQNPEERTATINFLINETMKTGKIEITSTNAGINTSLKYFLDGELLLTGTANQEGRQFEIFKEIKGDEIPIEFSTLDSVFANQEVRSNLFACFLAPEIPGDSTTGSSVSPQHGDGDNDFRECEMLCISNAQRHCDRASRQQSTIGAIVAGLGVEAAFVGGLAVPLIGGLLFTAGAAYTIYQEFVAEPACTESAPEPCAEGCNFIYPRR